MRKQKRIAHGLEELGGGNLELLHNDELAAALPDYLSDVADEDTIEEALQLLTRLGEAAVSDDKVLCSKAIMILSLSAERILAGENSTAMSGLAEVLLAWLVRENEFIAGYEVLCRQLQAIGSFLLRCRLWLEAEQLLTALHDIHSGKVKKKNSMRSVVGRSLENVGNPEMIGNLYEDFFRLQGGQQRGIERILLLLGRPAVLHGLTLLEEREHSNERQPLIHFLTLAGRAASRVFEEKMLRDCRWDVRCVMLTILCDMKDDGVYPLIEMNLSYPDVRVQREAVNCIVRSGGEIMIQRLTESMRQVDDSLKNVIIKKLARLDSIIIRDALLALLDEIISGKDFSDELLLSSIVVALRPYPDTRALIQLRELRDYFEEAASSRKLMHLLDDTLLMLESEMRHRRHRKIESVNVDFSDDPEAIRQAKRKTHDIEREIIGLLEQGKGELAAHKLFNRCVEAAREKDFVTAERLRDRILGVHSGSLDLVMEAEEIIGWERESKIPAHHFELWKALRQAIGVKQFEALYGALEPEEYQNDEIIAREGERDDRLYFINSGSVSLICTTGSAKTFLKRLQPGSVIGADQFFSISVWTVTARARTPVGLHSLKRSVLQELEQKFPGIAKNLQNYCAVVDSVPELLKMSGGERRSSARFPVEAIIRTMLVDAYGAAGNRSYVGQLQDVSQGGFSYSIGIANGENARLLLGRQVRFEMQLENDTTVEVQGLVVGIEPVENKKEMFKVHVKMIESLSAAEIRKIVEMLN